MAKRSLVNANDFMLLANSKIRIPCMKDIPITQRNGITQKQRDYLHSMGIGYSQLRYYGQIKPVLKLAIQREKAGLASPAQMRTMQKIGITDVHLRTKEEASYIIAGGDPEQYDGFCVVFKFDGNKMLTATTRKQARELLDWLKTKYHDIEYKMI